MNQQSCVEMRRVHSFKLRAYQASHFVIRPFSGFDGLVFCAGKIHRRGVCRASSLPAVISMQCILRNPEEKEGIIHV